MTVSPSLRAEVRRRASNRCEYCSLAQSSFPLVQFHVEHVIARQHGGADEVDNLCLACHWCNLHKGPNIASILSGEVVRLFNPRTDRWSDHFRVIEGVVEGLSEVGLVTARLLNMNDPDRVALRMLTGD
ncbi:MAG: HNH endonuclease [Planctomycetales bacterium]|nr:HNH endonuclease [Planctomycetales bacterium]